MIPGLASIAVPVADQGAIAVLWLGRRGDVAAIVARLTAAADAIASRL